MPGTPPSTVTTSLWQTPQAWTRIEHFLAAGLRDVLLDALQLAASVGNGHRNHLRHCSVSRVRRHPVRLDRRYYVPVTAAPE